jgi:ankyrin repeat protein
MAEELLKRHRLNAVQDNSQTGLRRAFTTSKKKSYDPKEIYHALDAHVGNCGSPGIAEALIFKLISTGGNLTTPTTNKRSSLLNRRKSMERMEPTRILQKAVENCQTDMVSVLVQHADHFALDSALPIAIRSGNLVIVELLLRYGANASQTADGQDAFRQACITGGQSDLIGLILQSDGRPSQSWVSECMIDATRKGCLDSVLRLSRSTADGNYHDAAALKHAIAQCRVDIALAILTGSKPPTGRGLDEAFGDLFGNNSILPNEKMALTQALLCAGASGDVVSAALVQACEIEFYEMVDLLVSHGASVEYQDAIVLRKAVSKGRSSLISLLLTERTSLSRTYASECVEYIPKNIAFEDRHAFLSTLLRKGAAGPPIDKALVDAVKAGDIESAKLLLTPHFPGGRVATGNNPSQSPRGMVYDRHNTASVDHRGGEALRLAIISNSVPMVKILLNVKPSPDTLARVFPQIRDLSPVVRCQMAELFLSTGLTGPCVSAALQEAIEVKPPQRDERFISLLLSYNADVNFNDGAGILSAIAHEDIHLLERLLKNRPSLQIAATGISKAMVIVDRSTRYKTVSLLIGVGLGQQSTKEVSEAMVYVLQSKLLDSKLLSLLLEHGKADVNFMHGSPIIHGMSSSSHSKDLLDRKLTGDFSRTSA